MNDLSQGITRAQIHGPKPSAAKTGNSFLFWKSDYSKQARTPQQNRNTDYKINATLLSSIFFCKTSQTKRNTLILV